jgi:hypothetical protein
VVTLFISYRRTDSEAHAGRLYESLMNRLPGAEIFMDVDSLRAGQDFVESLDKALSSAEVVLVIIGRQWVTTADKSGRRRLEDKDDFVRREVGRALARNLPVIPVLVQEAALPGEDQLPEDIKLLARRQSIELRHVTWSDDVARLAEAIEFLAPQPGSRVRRPGPARKSGRLTDVLRGAAIVCLLTLIAVACWFTWKYAAAAPQREIESLGDQVRYEYPEEKVRAALESLRDAVVRRNNPQLTSLAVARLKAIVLITGDKTDKGRRIRAGAMELIKVLRNNNLTIDFRKDDLKEADLVRVDLSRVNLKGVSLEEAFLLSTDFSGSDLTGANLSGAFVRNTTFSGVTLTGANIGELDWFNAGGFTASELSTTDPSRVMRCPADKGTRRHSIAAFEAEFGREYDFTLEEIGDDKTQLLSLWKEYSAPGSLCDTVDKWPGK